MRWRITLLFCGLLVWLGASASAEAQDLLKLFSGKGQGLNIQTSAELAKARLKQRLEQLRTKRKRELQGQSARHKVIVQKIKEYQKTVDRIEKRLATGLQKKNGKDQESLRKHKAFNRERRNTLEVIQHHIKLLKKLRGVMRTRNQSIDDLVDALGLSLRVRESFMDWLTSRFPTSDKQKVLHNSYRSSQDSLKNLEKELEQSNLRLSRLRKHLQKNNKELRQTRRRLLRLSEDMDDLPGQQNTGNKPSTSQVQELEKKLKSRRLRRRERRRLRAALKKARLEAKKKQEEAAKKAAEQAFQRRLQRMRTWRLRHRVEAYQTHKRLILNRLENENLQNESIKVRLHLHQFMQEKAKEALERMANKAKGGLLYRSPPELSGALLTRVGQHTSQIVRDMPENLAALSKQMYRNVWSQAQPGLYLLMVFVVFLLVLLALWGRRRLRRWLERLKARDEQESNTQQLWRALLLTSRTLYDVLPYAVILLAVGTALWAFRLPLAWNRMFLTLGLMILIVRAVFTSADLLFADDVKVRFLSTLEDDDARRFRLVCKAFAGFAFLYVPFLQGLELLAYPKPFLYDLRIIFYAFLLLSLFVIFLSKEAVLRLIPTDVAVGRAIAVFLNHFYLLAFVLMLGLFGLYVTGYINLAAFLARNSAQTIALLIAAYALYQLLWAFGLWVFGFSRKGQGLVQVERRWARNLLRLTRWLSGIVLVLLVVLLIFEIWGVAHGFTTIASLFTRPFFHIQQTQITLLSLLKLIFAVAGAIWLSRFLKKNLREFVYPALRTSLPNQHAANTVVGYVVIVIGVLFGLQWMGVGIGILAVFAGVIGIGVGFGLQNIANNFISGMILTFGQPIKVSDVIEVGGLVGIVREISARSTTIETNDGKLILVPNADILTTKVINWSLGPKHIYIQLKVGVAYGSDISLVRETLVQIAREHKKVLSAPPPFVRFQDFGASSLDFELWAGIRNPMQRFDVLSDLRFEVDRRFAELGIVIAFPQQDLHLNPELEEVLIDSFRPKPATSRKLLDEESGKNDTATQRNPNSAEMTSQPSGSEKSSSTSGERWHEVSASASQPTQD